VHFSGGSKGQRMGSHTTLLFPFRQQSYNKSSGITKDYPMGSIPKGYYSSEKNNASSLFYYQKLANLENTPYLCTQSLAH
jgi:hypothetical protein